MGDCGLFVVGRSTGVGCDWVSNKVFLEELFKGVRIIALTLQC
jgi:hypothetical protein